MGDTEVDAARRAAFAAFRQSLSKGRKKAKPPSFDLVESTKPLVIKALLSREEIDSVFEAARQCGTTRSEATTRLAGFSARAKDDSGTAAQEAFATMGLAYDIAYSDAHVALFMHRDGWLAREWPLLVAKLVHAMRSQEGDWGDREALCSATSVRCAEFHSYAESGGLLDENHRDLGSTLTMSVLLSDEQAQEGGDFVTWDKENQRVAWPMQRGDAILFHSEKRHGVNTVTKGMRHALVMELWEGADNANVVDRYS